MKRTHDYFDVVTEVPKGWEYFDRADTPIPFSVFISNGKGAFNGRILMIFQPFSVCELTDFISKSKNKQVDAKANYDKQLSLF